MKKSIQNRIRKGLFPEMPQTFADRLTGALKIGGAFNADQRSADEAPTAPVLPERSKRRFPFGKIFNGVAAAVLAALCIVIAVFGIILPNVQKTHGATHPDGYRADFPVGKWTRTRSKYASQGTDYSWIDVDMESWQSWLEITADGHAHLTEYDSESGEALHADFSVAIGSDGIQTDWESCTGMWYDTAADTICMEIVGRRRDYYSRTPDAEIPESKMSPEDMLEGLWCALSVDPGEDGLLEIRFYTEAAATERKALIVKDGVSYDGYSYTVEKWEQSQKNTGNLWYRFTFIDGDEELTIDLCMDTDGKEPIYMDWNLDKSEEGQKTYLKCPVIEANELPMQYTEYYGAGEGFVGFLAAVDLNGDGNPVRVKVTSDDPNWFIEKGEEPELTVQIGRGEWTANEVLVWDSVIFADLDPNDGHGNVLLSVKRTDGTIFTYELHSEDDTVVCGHVAEGDSNTYAMSTNINLYEKTSVGAWSHTVGVGYKQRITIRADGTATLKQTAGALGTFEVQLTYTETDGKLQFVSAYTGRNDSFTAVYDAERDVLAVTRNGETAEYERCIPDLAGSKWTLMDMKKISGNGIDAGGDLNEPELIGPEMYLEFDADGTVTVTVLYGDETVRRTFRSIANGTSIDIPDADETVITDTLEYDAATDTLRMYYVSYSGLQADMIFSRTPDAEIPSPEPEKTDDNIVTSEADLAALRAKYPEYFGLDTESGLKVFVAEFACDSFSCTLLSGKDKDKTLLDISTMPGMTVGEMLSVLLTYDIPSEKIEVIPYVNPLSSYAYNIDALYTSYVTWKIKGGLPYLDAVQFDLDGDGREELCTLTYGPTSGLFTVVFSAYRDGKVIAQNVYNLHYGELYFEKTADGLRLSHTYSQWADSAPQTDIWLVSLKGGRIVWTNEKTGEEFSGYWGDESWNLDGKEPASDDMSEVNVSRTYLCVGATAGDRIVPTPWGYLSELNGLEAVENDPENATGDFVWVTRTYHTSVPDGQPKLAWGELRCGEEETPAAALRLETDLTDGGEPVVVHFALCDQPMEYGFLDEGIADAGPLVPEPTAATLFYADWDEDGVYEYLAYLKLPEIGKCLISDGERTLVLSDCVSVRGFYSDLDSKSPYGNLILSTEAADGSERVYELHPEGDAIVIGKTLNGYCFVDDGTLTENEPYDLCISEPSPFGSARGFYTVHGDALTQWANSWEHDRLALEFDGIDIQRDRDRLIKEGLLLKLKRDLPCTLNGKEGLLEAGTYVYLLSYFDTLTEAILCTEDGRGVKVTMNGDADDLRIDGIPVSDYFDNAPRG